MEDYAIADKELEQDIKYANEKIESLENEIEDLTKFIEEDKEKLTALEERIIKLEAREPVVIHRHYGYSDGACE